MDPLLAFSELGMEFGGSITTNQLDIMYLPIIYCIDILSAMCMNPNQLKENHCMFVYIYIYTLYIILRKLSGSCEPKCQKHSKNTVPLWDTKSCSIIQTFQTFCQPWIYQKQNKGSLCKTTYGKWWNCRRRSNPSPKRCIVRRLSFLKCLVGLKTSLNSITVYDQWIPCNVLRKGFDAVNSFSAYLGGFNPLWNQSNLHIFSNREIGKHFKHLWNDQQFEEYLTSNFLKKNRKSCLEDSSTRKKTPAKQLLGHYIIHFFGEEIHHCIIYSSIVHCFRTGLDAKVFHDAMNRMQWSGFREKGSEFAFFCC